MSLVQLAQSRSTMKNCLLSLMLIGYLSGCSSDTMTISSHDGQTGQSSAKTYSKFYDAGAWLIKDKLGVVIAVDHQKKVIPFAHGAAKSMGMLGEGDSWASGKVTVYLYNFDGVAYPVKLMRLTVPKGFLPLECQPFNADAHARTGAEVGEIPLFNYSTSVDCTLELEVNGRPRKVALHLERRLVADLGRLYGENGVRPYPWGWRKTSDP